MNQTKLIKKLKELVKCLKQTYPGGLVFCEWTLGENITKLESEISALESEPEFCPICKKTYLTDSVCLTCTQALCTPLSKSEPELKDSVLDHVHTWHFIASHDYPKTEGKYWVMDNKGNVERVFWNNSGYQNEPYCFTNGQIINSVQIVCWVESILPSMPKLQKAIASLESEPETNKHNTCDGCQMFQDCGCMLDVSVCPDCWEHDMWNAKEPETKTAEEMLNEFVINGVGVYEGIQLVTKDRALKILHKYAGQVRKITDEEIKDYCKQFKPKSQQVNLRVALAWMRDQYENR